MARVFYGIRVFVGGAETVIEAHPDWPDNFPVRPDGWNHYCIWEHSVIVRDLYARRCRLEVEEMTCHTQAVDLLAAHVTPGDTLLDVGCGSGYFFHALQRRQIPVEYYGIDASPSLIKIGRQVMPAYGLEPERLQVLRIEDLLPVNGGSVDHVVCTNVLSNLDSFHRPLERLLQCARKTIVLRESMREAPSQYLYVKDKYLDREFDLNVYVNIYNQEELIKFIEAYGFRVAIEVDRRTQGSPELVIDYAHYWKFILALKNCRRSKGWRDSI